MTAIGLAARRSTAFRSPRGREREKR